MVCRFLSINSTVPCQREASLITSRATYKMRPIITLTTDFGLDDPFVGIMKGVILTIAPEADLIDITHQIGPQNITHAAHVLQSAYNYFPEKTIHLVVVDPGVGGQRRSLVAEYKNHVFVAPDNGVLTPVIKTGVCIRELTRPRYFLKPVSSTFHGRDVFAPVAAWVARGTKLSDLGRKITDPQVLALPQPTFKENILTGQIIYKDRFGNLTSNISVEWLDRCFGNTRNLEVKLGKKKTGMASSYSQMGKGEYGAIINSWNNLEIFCRENNAAKKLRCTIGATVTVTPAKQ